MLGQPILIIENNPINLKLAYILLSTEGYKVKVATDAEEALIMLKDFHPALILMDLQLPGMDGIQLTQIFKKTKRPKTLLS